MMTIYPDYIAPLFNNFEELKEGELKNKIKHLAHKINFPLKKIY